MIFSPARGRPSYSNATHNIVFDGNSLIYGQGASSTQYIAARVAASGALSGSGITCPSFGIQGQTWQQMINAHGDVDAAFVSGKRNILFVLEGVNSIFLSSRTGLQAATDAANYATAVKAVHPEWELVFMSTPACRFADSAGAATFGGVAAVNAQVEIQNLQAGKNYKDMGYSYFLNLRRPGSPFYFTGYTDADFSARNSYYQDRELFGSAEPVVAGRYLHYKNAGYQIFADLCQQQLRMMNIKR